MGTQQSRSTVLVLGDSKVGKTQLIKTLAGQTYQQGVHGQTKQKLQITKLIKKENNHQYYLTLIQLPLTADGDVNETDKQLYYSKTNAVIFLYDLTNRTSFDNLPKWIKDFERYNKKKICKFLIGTKRDLSIKVVVKQSQTKNLTILFGLLQGTINACSTSETFSQCRAIVQTIKEERRALKREPTYKIKVTVVGDVNSGKTVLCQRLAWGKFIRQFEVNSSTAPTIGVNLKVRQMVDTRSTYKVEIIDTSGNEVLRLKMYEYLKQAEAVMLVYSLTDRHGQQTLPVWFQQIQKHCYEDIPIVIVANKADIAKDQSLKTPEAKFLRQKYPFYFCSAKTGQNLNLVMEAIIKKLNYPEKGLEISLQQLLESSGSQRSLLSLSTLVKVAQIQGKLMEELMK